MGEQFCFENVTLKFGGVTALNDLSFSVEPGTLHALIGPNGAGKSSVLNVLSGLYQPQSGGVRFGATDLLATAASARPRHGISRTFQNVVLSRRQSVLENLMLGRHHLMRHSFTRAMLRLPSSVRQDAEHEAACTAIAERLGIANILHSPVHSLSYGTQKLVELGRGLAAEPQLLLLDEPVAGMNSSESVRIGAMIHELQREGGYSVLLIEHDMNVVMKIADRVTVIDFGRLVAEGTPDEVKRHPGVLEAYLGGSPDDAPSPATKHSPEDSPAGGPPASMSQESRTQS